MGIVERAPGLAAPGSRPLTDSHPRSGRSGSSATCGDEEQVSGFAEGHGGPQADHVGQSGQCPLAPFQHVGLGRERHGKPGDLLDDQAFGIGAGRCQRGQVRAVQGGQHAGSRYRRPGHPGGPRRLVLAGGDLGERGAQLGHRRVYRVKGARRQPFVRHARRPGQEVVEQPGEGAGVGRAGQPGDLGERLVEPGDPGQGLKGGCRLVERGIERAPLDRRPARRTTVPARPGATPRPGSPRFPGCCRTSPP